MVVIRLSRGGAKKRPFYNIVATDRRNRRDGRFLERLGYYNPMAAGGETGFTIEMDRVEHWTKQGAQVSDAVNRLIKADARDGEPPKSNKKTRAMKKAAAAAAAPAEEAEEAPAEDADAAPAEEGGDEAAAE